MGNTFVPGTVKNICGKFQYRNTKDRSVSPLHSPSIFRVSRHTLLSSFVTEVVKWKQGHRSIVCRRGTVLQVPLISYWLIFPTYSLLRLLTLTPPLVSVFCLQKSRSSLWRCVADTLFYSPSQLAFLHSSFIPCPLRLPSHRCSFFFFPFYSIFSHRVFSESNIVSVLSVCFFLRLPPYRVTCLDRSLSEHEHLCVYVTREVRSVDGNGKLNRLRFGPWTSRMACPRPLCI